MLKLTDIYNVQIHYNKDSIIDMECDCLYTQEGKNCKHMVAVLLEYEERYDTKMYKDICAEDTHNEEDIDTLIKQANENQVHQFFHDVLSQDSKLLLQFKSMLKTTLFYHDLLTYEETLNEKNSKNYNVSIVSL